MHKLSVSMSASLHDHHGNLVHRYTSKPAHSFLAQLIELLYVHMAQATLDITITSGAETSTSKELTNFKVSCSAPGLEYGIVIGTGTDANTIDAYVLQTPITSDITTTDHTFALSYPTVNTRRLSISRSFTNTSASTITIEEVGLYSYHSSGKYLCLDRTLYSVSIPAAQSLTLTYRIDVSV